MLTGRNPDPQRVLVMHADTVGADIGPLAVRIFHDHHAAGADITAAVFLMPTRRRELEQIDFVTAIDVLDDRSAGNFRRLDRRLLTEPLLPSANDFQTGQLRIEPES
jgi:hypothetical protein